MNDIYSRLITIVMQSTELAMTEQDIIESNYSLLELGYDSMSFTNMLIGIENEFGFPIDPSAPLEELTDIRNLVRYIESQTVVSL